MSDKPENANPAGQGRVHLVSSQATSGTITVPGLLSKQEKDHGGWWAISEHSFRLIERTLDDPAERRKAKTAFVTLHRVANLKGLTTFTAQISSLARDMDFSYRHAAEALDILEVIGLCTIKRAQVTGTKLKAPSEYTVFPPIVQKVTSIVPTENSAEIPRIPKNSSKNESIHPYSEKSSGKAIVSDSHPAESGMHGKGLEAPDPTSETDWAKARRAAGIRTAEGI